MTTSSVAFSFDPPRSLITEIRRERLAQLAGYPSADHFTDSSWRVAREAGEWMRTRARTFVEWQERTIVLRSPHELILEDEVRDPILLSDSGVVEPLTEANARSTLLVLFGIEQELEEALAASWKHRPDHAYFLDRWAVAVVENLFRWLSEEIQRQAKQQQHFAAPPLAPGHRRWNVAGLSTFTQAFPRALPAHAMAVLYGITPTPVPWPKDTCQACLRPACEYRHPAPRQEHPSHGASAT